MKDFASRDRTLNEEEFTLKMPFFTLFMVYYVLSPEKGIYPVSIT